MKKAIATMFVLALAGAGVWAVQSKPVLTASQNYIVQEVNGLKPFTALSVSGQAEVVFKQGPEGIYAAALYGPDNLLDSVSVASDGKTLSVSYKEPLTLTGKSRIKVTVQAPTLERVEARESGEVKVPGVLSADNLEVFSDGKGDAEFSSVNVSSFKADVRGDSEVEIDSLACRSLEAVTADRASFESERTVCSAVDVKASGHSEASVSGISGRTAAAYGDDAAEVELRGSVTSVTLTARGKSEVDAGSLAAETAEAAAMDSAKAYVRTSGTLNAQAHGRGIVEYKGWPEQVNRSGKTGNIRQDR